MSIKTLLVAATALPLLAGAAFAQTSQPTPAPVNPPVAQTAPAPKAAETGKVATNKAEPKSAVAKKHAKAKTVAAKPVEKGSTDAAKKPVAPVATDKKL
jgi:hypothetical protein